MNWLDLGIFIIVVALVAVSIKRGFMKSVLSHFSFSLNALLSFFLCKPIQSILNKLFHVGDAIANHYSSSLIDKSSDFAENLISFSSQSELHTFVKETIKKGDFNSITKTMFNWFLNKRSLYTTLKDSGLESRNLAEIISGTFASYFTVIIAFLVSILLI